MPLSQMRHCLCHSEILGSGSLISAYGTLDKSGDAPVLNASAGRVAVHLNELAGAVTSVSPLTISVAYLNGMRPTTFNFDGTGSSGESNANPRAYIIDTTGLTLGTYANGDVIRIRGFVQNFGAAHPDFNATALAEVKHETKGAEVTINWRPGTTTPFTAASANALNLDLTGAHSELHLADVQQTDEGSGVTSIVPKSDGTGTFAIAIKGTGGVTLYKTFAEFVDALNTQINGTRRVLRLSASGQYNAVDSALVAQRVGVQISEATQ